jgi:hypothetical protein
VSSERNNRIGTTDEALGSETKTFPSFSAAPISTLGRKPVRGGTAYRVIRDSGHFTKRVTEHGWTKTDLPSNAEPGRQPPAHLGPRSVYRTKMAEANDAP